jgi:hypothetical protein
VGVIVPLVAILLLRIPGLRASERYEPLGAFSAGLAVLGITSVTHTNEFLGAFAAGSPSPPPHRSSGRRSIRSARPSPSC